jgi:hypothetical protein
MLLLLLLLLMLLLQLLLCLPLRLLLLAASAVALHLEELARVGTLRLRRPRTQTLQKCRALLSCLLLLEHQRKLAGVLLTSGRSPVAGLLASKRAWSGENQGLRILPQTEAASEAGPNFQSLEAQKTC